MPRMKKLSVLAFALLALLPSDWAHAELLRFREVAPRIYRGSMPENLSDLLRLKDLGIKTIYTLVTTQSDIDWEQRFAEAMGMHVVSVPLNPLLVPADEKIDYLLQEIQDPANQPVYLHCRHGKDRTGLIFGLFRVETQGWDPHLAYQEMRDIGFNPWLVGLEYYYWHRVGRSNEDFAYSAPQN